MPSPAPPYSVEDGDEGATRLEITDARTRVDGLDSPLLTAPVSTERSSELSHPSPPMRSPRASYPSPMESPGIQRSTSQMSSFSVRVGARLAFSDCTLTVSSKGTDGKRTEKRLLDRVSGSLEAGRMLCLMGPSGAGKTTLLNLIALQGGGGRAHGWVTLNGHQLTAALLKQHASVVPQFDLLWAPLTCHEHLVYAIELYHTGVRAGLLADARRELLDDLLLSTGLISCADTRAGNDLMRGLSGGQKRRLSLALALAKKPKLIFLDEPTSGLDAAAAASIMRTLKEVAVLGNLAIMCTIHQPSTSVFAGFDALLVLSRGRVAYNGAASDMSAFLGTVGRAPPPSANPADHMLDLVNEDFSDAGTAREVVDAWGKREDRLPEVRPEVQLKQSRQVAPCTHASVCLVRKHVRLALLDPSLYVARAVFFMVANIYFAIVYIKTRELTQEQVVPRLFLCGFTTAAPASMGLIVVVVLHIELQIVRREVQSGMYSVAAYLCSTTAIQLPMMVCLSFFALVPAGYGIGAYPWSRFGPALLVYTPMLWSFEGVAQVASLLGNPLVGMLTFMLVWFTCFLYNGLFVNPDSIIWPLRLLTYIDPLTYVTNQLVYNIFARSPPYGGTHPCAPGELTPPCPTLGVKCLDSASVACFGKEGLQILKSLNTNFAVVTAQDRTLRTVGIVLAITLGFKVAHVTALLYNFRQARALSTATAGEPSTSGPNPDPNLNSGLSGSTLSRLRGITEEAVRTPSRFRGISTEETVGTPSRFRGISTEETVGTPGRLEELALRR